MNIEGDMFKEVFAVMLREALILTLAGIHTYVTYISEDF